MALKVVVDRRGFLVLTKQIHKLLLTILILMTIHSQQNDVFVQASSAHSINGATSKTSNSMTTDECQVLSFLDELRRKYQHQPTFLQAVEEMALSLTDLFQDPKDGEFYKRVFLLMAEPERIISFRVPWMDDEGRLQRNRAWRVEFSR